MIRFCDKNVYNIKEGEMTRTQMLGFFLESEERQCSVLAVYSTDSSYLGIITYYSLLEQNESEFGYTTETITISEHFWEQAKEYFGIFPNLLLPVMNVNGDIIGFAFDDASGYYQIEEGIKLLGNEYARAYFAEKYFKVQMIVITDLNELAWNCYLLFRKMGYEICVIGEKWEWFNFKSGDKYLDYPEYAKFYIYAEGAGYIRTEDEQQLIKQQWVRNAFRFIIDLNDEIMKYIFQVTLEGLLYKGISVCECIVPAASSVQYRTELEQKCGENKVSLEKYMDGSREEQSQIEKYIFEMYGEKNVMALKDGRGKKGRYIPVGSYVGQTVGDLPYKKRIYLIGPCIADGYGCLAEDSLNAQLQQLVACYGYQMVAICIEMFNWTQWMIHNIDTIPIREKDIVLVIYDSEWFLNGGGMMNVLKWIYLLSIITLIEILCFVE